MKGVFAVATNFTDRLLADPDILHLPANPTTTTDPLVFMVRDQLLVSTNLAGPVAAWLENRGIAVTPLTTVIGDLAPPGPQPVDVGIWELNNLPAGWSIATVVDHLRAAHAPAHGEPRGVSPNHILIPASLSDACPSGPPSNTMNQLGVTSPSSGKVNVNAVDSGYIWEDGWKNNPLDGIATISYHQGRHPVQGGWQDDSPDVPNPIPTEQKVLGALEGHANFVAGLIAQYSSKPTIAIWNHNGGFVEGSRDRPTEASVIHSLIECQLTTPAPVVNAGFAFPAYAGIVSSAWDILFEIEFPVVGQDFVVVSPTGNQWGSQVPRYPAALNHTYPKRFQSVIGVASRGWPHADLADPSEFTNVGPWVNCATNGEAVISTFIRVDLTPEEDPPGTLPVDFTKNSLASWNGTCFAAAQITGRIAYQIQEKPVGTKALAAWGAVFSGFKTDPKGMLGLIL
jgi:hypothetical protein